MEENKSSQGAKCTSESLVKKRRVDRNEALSILEGRATGLRISTLELGLLSLNLGSVTSLITRASNLTSICLCFPIYKIIFPEN